MKFRLCPVPILCVSVLFIKCSVGDYSSTTVETTTFYWPTVTDTSGDSVEVTTIQQFSNSEDTEVYYVLFFTELVNNQSALCPNTLRIYERLVDLGFGTDHLYLEDCWSRYGDLLVNSTLNSTDFYFEFRGMAGEVYYSGSYDEYDNAMDALGSTETIPDEARVLVTFHLNGDCPRVPYTAEVDFVFSDKHNETCDKIPAPLTIQMKFTVNMSYGSFLKHIIDGYNEEDSRNILLHNNQDIPDKARIILVLFQSNNDESFHTFSNGITQNSSEYTSVMNHYYGKTKSLPENAKIRVLCEYDYECYAVS